MFKQYYHLTKPGIIYGNTLTTAAGFLLASKGHVDFWLFVATLVGVALVMASGCVFNNYIDRGIDKKMARTKQRALVTGEISGRHALIFATVLGGVGLVTLGLFVNVLTVFLGLLALFMYVVVYGYWKRRSPVGTIVGSVSGALPPVAGYCAVTGSVDDGAVILFLILALWQMPHFYSIAIYRRQEYAAAGIPVLPLRKGVYATKIHILLYIAAFVLATMLLTVSGYTGFIFAAVMLAVGGAWFLRGLQGFKADDNRWARKMFGFSLLVLLVLSGMLAIGGLLP